MADLTPTQKIAAAMLWVSDPSKGKAPYYGVALAMLVRVKVDNLLAVAGGEMAVTENGILLYDPVGIDKWTVPQLGAVLEHEIQHVLLQHMQRARKLGIAPRSDDAKLANFAMDACINDSLRKIGRPLPSDCIYSEDLGQPENLIFEEHFRRLKADAQQAKKALEGESGPGRGQCGGCAGNPSPAEDEYSKQGRSEAELQRARKQTAEAVKDYAEKGRGTVPSELERWATEFLGPPKIDWRAVLARVIRNALAWKSGCTDLGFARPSRRQAGLGFGVGRAVLPSLRSPVIRVAVIVDTSGSMSDAELGMALNEVRGVLTTTGSDVDLCACDAEVHGIKAVRSWTDARKALKGGGGTDMRPAFAALLTQRSNRPSIIVCITDGQVGNGVPDVAPHGVRVIWVLVGPYQTKPCDWGECISIPHEKAA